MPAADHATPGLPRLHGSTRRTPTVLLAIAAALLAARVVTGVYEHAHPPSVPDRVAWRAIAGAEAEARQTGKPILYDFSAAWCGPCRQMEREVFGDEKSATTIENMFVPVRVVDRQREDGRNTPEVEALMSRYAIQSFPTLVVAMPDGAGQPVTMAGYGGRATMMQELMRAAVKARSGR